MTDNPNAFIGFEEPPTAPALRKALGESKRFWNAILKRVKSEMKLTTQEWHSYSKKAGWFLRVKKGDRNIVYLSPCIDGVRIAFLLGDKAMAAARNADLPAAMMKTLDESKRYMEGTAVRLLVESDQDVDTVLKLVAVKLAN